MVVKRALSALSKVAILIAIAVAFIIGLGGTIYFSLRSPEVKVPDVKGKDRMTAESELDDRGLHMRVRATRLSADAKPDTVIDQSPQKDEVIKVGQTVAVVVARAAKEGETAAPSSTNENKAGATENKNANQSSTSAGNQNENQNRPKRNKNTNKNANNSNANNTNNGNGARGVNRNANQRNANNGNANVPKANGNANRTVNNANANRRPPVISNPTSVPSGTTP